MKETFDLSQLDWTLSGWTPYLWGLMQTLELGEQPDAEVQGMSVRIPGSVQATLRDAGLIPDWNLGANWQQCEWVENRHWIYEAVLPASMLPEGRMVRLVCDGLDFSGWVHLNHAQIGEFRGTHVPHSFDLTPHLKPGDNKLRIIFDMPPRWLGQFGHTSRMTEWKVRFNYTWDWQPRLVQIGIWEPMRLEVTDGAEVRSFTAVGDADAAAGTGILRARGLVAAPEGSGVTVELMEGGTSIRRADISAAAFNTAGVAWDGLPVRLWWPNLAGDQPLYTVRCTLHTPDGARADAAERRVGFRSVEWRQCDDAPAGADPWICVINGKPTFLQGVNFAPLLPNFADLTEERYRAFLSLYRELGVNIFRINGVGYLEKTWLYDLCDEMGILVWQDVPLSSSGLENIPPDEPLLVAQMAETLRSFIARRRHHPSLLLWCGGNELQRVAPEGYGSPLEPSHPMPAALRAVAEQDDPGRRFLTTTSTGPRFTADAKDFGKGVHWDVHGPWKPWDDLTDWAVYFGNDDALFRSETGAPGCASVDLIRRYAGELEPMPVNAANLFWRRPVTWWIENAQFAAEKGRQPETLEEYVDWSRQRQADALRVAVSACKRRFPKCGGVMLWTGHDCFPCPTNTSIIDFEGQPKPAALALKEVWHAPAGEGA